MPCKGSFYLLQTFGVSMIMNLVGFASVMVPKILNDLMIGSVLSRE